MRYTEARLTKFTQEVYLADLDKNIIDFGPNFDETEKEPQVLPVRIPNLLVNGAEGIAVGMATSIPTHNLGEVIDAVKAYMKNEAITTKQLMKYLKGPDFPTGGIVVNKDDLLDIYETGQGKIKIRGKVEVEELKGGKKQLVINRNPIYNDRRRDRKVFKRCLQFGGDEKDNGYRRYFQSVFQEGIRIVLELKKRCRCGESEKYALQKDPAGRYIRRQYVGSGKRKTGNAGVKSDHRASCGFSV